LVFLLDLEQQLTCLTSIIKSKKDSKKEKMQNARNKNDKEGKKNGLIKRNKMNYGILK
jgi:hypothetical protein